MTLDQDALVAAADVPEAGGRRTCARCGWLTTDRLCPNCGADPDAAVV